MKPCYVFAFSLCLTSALSAETKPTYNMYGTLGMIDMPSAEMTSDGMLAIARINLAIKDKEFIVFVGPSGCGKSTLLAHHWKRQPGRDPNRGRFAAPIDRGISMVFPILCALSAF